MVQIPLIDNPNQELNVILEEQECTIALYKRGDYYYLDLYADATDIVKGALVQPQVALIQAPTTFKGNLYFIDTLNPPEKQNLPNYELFSTRFALVYLTEDECVALGLKF